VQPRGEARIASKLRDPDAQLDERLLRCVTRVFGIGEDMGRDALDARRVAVAERVERTLVAVLRSSDQDRIAQPLVDERPLGPRGLRNLTALAQGGLHGGA
jgi:hypothetical protein